MEDEQFLRDILQRLARIEENTKGLDMASRKADEAHVLSKQNEREIEEMKNNQTWLKRSVLILFIGYVVKLLFPFI